MRGRSRLGSGTTNSRRSLTSLRFTTTSPQPSRSAPTTRATLAEECCSLTCSLRRRPWTSLPRSPRRAQ
uniref:Uncharacterized protein n=1 Tax=uncultured marine virus TaxID=186617 RepID=A0A0F7L451_9VIRU|nr:hypothetical protein [uncultured marine virus]